MSESHSALFRDPNSSEVAAKLGTPGGPVNQGMYLDMPTLLALLQGQMLLNE